MSIYRETAVIQHSLVPTSQVGCLSHFRLSQPNHAIYGSAVWWSLVGATCSLLLYYPRINLQDYNALSIYLITLIPSTCPYISLFSFFFSYTNFLHLSYFVKCFLSAMSDNSSEILHISENATTISFSLLFHLKQPVVDKNCTPPRLDDRIIHTPTIIL